MRWCSRSAPRRTSSPSSCGTGTGSGWTAGRGRSTSTTVLANIQWDRTTAWVGARAGQPRRAARAPATAGARSGPGCTGASSSRRAATGSPARCRTTRGGGVNVLNLVAGRGGGGREPDGAFEPFVVHYAETFIVPAAVGAYTIRPHGAARGQRVRHDQGVRQDAGVIRPAASSRRAQPGAFDPGLDVRPRRQPMGFAYGPGVFGPAPELRSLDAIRPSLRDPACAGPDPVYAIAMDVAATEHRPELRAPQPAVRGRDLRRGPAGRGAGAQPGPRPPGGRRTAAGRRRSCTRSGAGARSSTCRSAPPPTPAAASRSRRARARWWSCRRAGRTRR